MTLLEENGFETDWAVYAYACDLQASRRVAPVDLPETELVKRVLAHGPPTKKEWVSNDARSSCAECQQKFHWLTCSKHHCRCCGEVFCDECSDKQSVLPFVGPEATMTPVRVCRKCHRINWGYMQRRISLDDMLLKKAKTPPCGPRPLAMTEAEFRLQHAGIETKKSKQDPPESNHDRPPDYSYNEGLRCRGTQEPPPYQV